MNQRLIKKVNTIFILVTIFVTSDFSLAAQDHNDHQIVLHPKPHDSISLKDCLLKAHWEAHSRSFLMTTINQGGQNDAYALASGAGIGVLTKPIYGFQVGVSGFFIYNLFSSELVYPNQTNGLSNRYEIGLFDLENPGNRNDLDRLEEFYIKYSISKSSITIGKLNLNTPFFNPQDGRMRPTLEEGLWLSVKEKNKIGLNGGWIWDVSPRSTVRWYTISNSIGIYPTGVNVNGSRADYQGNIEGSSGIAVVNVYYKPNDRWKLDVWNGFLENVMNTALIEAKYEIKNVGIRKYAGVIYLHQNAINHGGNANPDKTYMEQGGQSNVISAQLGIQKKGWNTNINYTHITGDGRYLMPREWGREVFYTFLNRERNEGLGNVHAVMLKATYTSENEKFSSSWAYGYYHLPDVHDYRLNKYGLPSYHQINYLFNYAFTKYLRGLELRFLAAYKINAGQTYNNPKFVFNKVNMVNLNLIFDFKI